MADYIDKIFASLTLGSYLDTLGFYNGLWEFNYNNTNKIQSEATALMWTNYIINHYYGLGGLNIDITNWNSSDDTILMMAIAKGCLNGGKEKDYIKSLLNYFNDLNDDKRSTGYTTILSLKNIKKTKTINSLEYSDKMGGNGAAIRSAPIGLIYYRENEIDKLIEQSIMSSRITHNYVYGFLGGLVTALFTSYAIRHIHPLDWCDKLLKLYESKKIDKYMKKTNIYDKYERDKNLFWDKWYEYRENILRNLNSDDLIPSFRMQKLKNLIPGISFNKKYINYSNWGSSGVGATILAYDALIRSISDNNINLDSVIVFSALHFGDNDSTGIIAGCWYGAYYGWNSKLSIKYKMKQLEFFKELDNISKNIIKNNKS
jgi:ADP-ribosylarginine hydrolase